MSINIFHTELGSGVYEFRTRSEGIAAIALYNRFIGNQHQFEIAMMLSSIPFAPRQEVPNRSVYRVDLTKDVRPFCVVASSMNETCDWVKANIVERGFSISNMDFL